MTAPDRLWTDTYLELVGDTLHDYLTGLGLPPEMGAPVRRAGKWGDHTMKKNIDRYHQDFLAIIRAMTGVRFEDVPHPEFRVLNGHAAIRALVEQIHDQGYVLGQRHAEGIFDEGEEVDVAKREQRLVSDLERQIEGTFG